MNLTTPRNPSDPSASICSTACHFLDITEEADDFVETYIANKVMPATTVILKNFNTFAPDRLAWLCSIKLSPPDFDAIARSHQILETEGVK